jgi:hypothetical protein
MGLGIQVLARGYCNGRGDLHSQLTYIALVNSRYGSIIELAMYLVLKMLSYGSYSS